MAAFSFGLRLVLIHFRSVVCNQFSIFFCLPLSQYGNRQFYLFSLRFGTTVSILFATNIYYSNCLMFCCIFCSLLRVSFVGGDEVSLFVSRLTSSSSVFFPSFRSSHSSILVPRYHSVSLSLALPSKTTAPTDKLNVFERYLLIKALHYLAAIINGYKILPITTAQMHTACRYQNNKHISRQKHFAVPVDY